MKKIFTIFLSMLFTTFLFGQGCPTSVDTDHRGRIHFHFDTPAAKEAAWNLFPSSPSIAVTINKGVIGVTRLETPLTFAKGTGGIVKNNTSEYFRTSNIITPFETEKKIFAETIILHYTTGDISCKYAQ